MPTVEANGQTLYLEEHGDGEPLVCVMGLAADTLAWALQVPAFAERHRAIFFDNRDAGRSSRAGGDYEIADMAQDTLALADALGLDSFHLLGYSMGGMTALHYASRFPDRIRTLVAISIGTEREPRLAVGRALMDPDRIERDEPDWAARLAARHDPLHGPGSWRRLLDAVVEDIAAQPLLTPRELRSIDAPTLVVAGDRDPFVPIPQAAALASQVRDGRLLVLPDVGHDALVDHLPVLDAALTDFYRSTEDVARDRARITTTTEVPT
jgi:pimeloyl-ACP methyl ester carboxylesterase